MGAQRSQGKERAALIGIAESWEKRARDAEDMLSADGKGGPRLVAVAIQRARTHWHRVRKGSQDLCAGTLDGVRALESTDGTLQRALMLAFMIIAGAVATSSFLVGKDSAAPNGVEPEMIPLHNTSALVQWKPEVNAPRNLAMVAIADFHPMFLPLVVWAPSQVIEISDAKFAAKASRVIGRPGIKRQPTATRLSPSTQ